MGKNKYFLAFFILFSLTLRMGLTQENRDDSLEQLLEDDSSDLDKQELLLKHARSKYDSDKETALQYFEKALQYESDLHKRAIIIDTLGLFSWQLGNFNEAIDYFNQALVIFKELNDSIWLGKVLNNIAVVNFGLGNRNEALEYYYKALNIRQTINDYDGISRVMNNIGMIYQEWSLYDEAIKWHKEALKISLEINNNELIAYSYSNIGNYYEKIKDFKNALKSYFLGQEYLLKEDENNHFNSYLSSFIGRAYSNLNRLDSALYYFEKSLEYANRINNKNFRASSYYSIGKIHFERNEIDSAELHVNNSYQLSKQNDYTELIKDNLFLLAEIEEKKGNINGAFYYFKEASAIKDSLYNTKQIKKFADLQISYFTEKQEQENILLKKNNEIQKATIRNQKTISTGLIVGGVLVLIILMLTLRSQIAFKKLSIKLETSEKELIKANADKDRFLTILAHDLKGPFGSFLGMTKELDENFDVLPSERVKKFIGILKTSSTKIFDLLEDLLKWAQIQTGKMQFKFEKINLYESCNNAIELLSAIASNKNIDLINHINKETNAHADEKAISTIFRNLISNAIKFTHPEGWVKIESITHDSKIEIFITDNGIGINQKDLEGLFDITEKKSRDGTAKEKGTGLGVFICKELIEKNNGTIRVESEQGKGSKFILTLPIDR